VVLDGAGLQVGLKCYLRITITSFTSNNIFDFIPYQTNLGMALFGSGKTQSHIVTVFGNSHLLAGS